MSKPVCLQFKDHNGTTLNGAAGCRALQREGPTTEARVFLDLGYVLNQKTPPDMSNCRVVEALVDTGAALSCIDEQLANDLDLPRMGSVEVSGVGGRETRELRLVQVYLPAFEKISYAKLAAVRLAEGGQRHQVLLGREFLEDYRMVYDGRSGVVVFESQSTPIPVIHSDATLKVLLSTGLGYSNRRGKRRR